MTFWEIQLKSKNLSFLVPYAWHHVSDHLLRKVADNSAALFDEAPSWIGLLC
jgi:hypothetical protein